MIRLISIVFCLFALGLKNDPFVDITLYLAIFSQLISLGVQRPGSY